MLLLISSFTVYKREKKHKKKNNLQKSTGIQGFLRRSTLPETNIAPENGSLEKEIPIGNHPFLGAQLLVLRRFLMEKKMGEMEPFQHESFELGKKFHVMPADGNSKEFNFNPQERRLAT